MDRVDVQRVLGGQIDAFAGIVERWQGPLVNLAYRFCHDAGRAEDLAQEAFLKIYRSLKQWRGEGQFSTWLFAVATNVYRSSLRRKSLPRVSLDVIADLASERREQHELEARERARLLRQAVRELPGRYRDAVILYYFHEMDVGAAALSLGLSEGTVKSHLHRARKILEKHLGDLLGPSTDDEEAAA